MCYNYLREGLGLNLPHPSTVRRWRPIKYVKPGIKPAVIENLKKLVAPLSKRERLCTLIFDEIEIKRELEYYKAEDVIEGFQEMGDGKRYNILANKCRFFMLKSICGNWKYVLSYYALAGDSY